MLFEITPLDVGKADLCLIHISLEIDFAMALMIRFDGKPVTELVSLIDGPQEELDRAVDEYLASHRYELTHRFKECPRCGYSVFREQAPASCPKRCGDLVDVRNLDLDEERIRQDAKCQLTGPGLLASQHANLCRRIVTENLKVPFSSQQDVARPLDEILQILHVRMRENVATLMAIATKANDAVFLGGRTDLLPQGSRLLAKHADYLRIRSKLEALGTWLSGLQYSHPEFVDYPSEYPLAPYHFSTPVELPVVSGAQVKEPVADQIDAGDTGTLLVPAAEESAGDQQDSGRAAGESEPGGKTIHLPDLMNASGEEITKHATSKAIADHFGWPVSRVRTELSKGYWGPQGKQGTRGRPDKPFWTINKTPLGKGADTQFLWVTRLVVPHLKRIFEQQP